MGDKFGFLSIVDFGATIWYIFPQMLKVLFDGLTTLKSMAEINKQKL